MRGVSYCAIAYAHSIGFDTAMQVGTFNGCPLYICKLLHVKEEPCIGLPQYVIVKNKEASTYVGRNYDYFKSKAQNINFLLLSLQQI